MRAPRIEKRLSGSASAPPAQPLAHAGARARRPTSQGAPLGSVRDLVGEAGFSSGPDEALAEHDGELGFCLGPFARRHFPFLNDLGARRERSVSSPPHRCSHGPPQLGVQRLDRIRRVDDFSDGRSEGEERDDLLPLAPPDLADRRVFAAHALSSKASSALRPASASAAR